MKTSCIRHPAGGRGLAWGGWRLPLSPKSPPGGRTDQTSGCPGCEEPEAGSTFPKLVWVLEFGPQEKHNYLQGESNFPPNLPTKEMNHHPSLTFCDSQANPPKGCACHPCPRPVGPREPEETRPPLPRCREWGRGSAAEPPGPETLERIGPHPECLRAQCAINNLGMSEGISKAEARSPP